MLILALEPNSAALLTCLFFSEFSPLCISSRSADILEQQGVDDNMIIVSRGGGRNFQLFVYIFLKSFLKNFF